MHLWSVRRAPPLCELMPPPRAMPGYVAAIWLDERRNGELSKDGLQAGIVAEMSWAEQQSSASYIYGLPFGNGVKIWWHATTYSPCLEIDGYTYVAIAQIVAWET